MPREDKKGGVPREGKKGGVPREDKKKSVPREDMVGDCHPEGKLRGLPGTSSQRKWGVPRYARQDKKWGLGRTDGGVARQDKKRGLGAKIVKNSKVNIMYNVG